MKHPKDIRYYDEDHKPYGYWEVYHWEFDNDFSVKYLDTLCFRGEFKNGIEIGLWEFFDREGKQFSKDYYIN